MKQFAITGVGGFVAPRHLKAISETGNNLVAALDLNDSVGILDRFFPDTQFFTSPVRFQRLIEKLRLDPNEKGIEYLSVCTPNHVHDAHIRMGLRAGADVICEKPLVLTPWNIDILQDLEGETGQRVYTVLQLRYHDSLIALKNELESQANREKADVVLTYITRRGGWYHVSWKGDVEKSGGVATNIGIHFFDLLIWLFGDVEHSEVHLSQEDKMAGLIELEHARVRWLLSIDYDDLPSETREAGGYAYRSITIDGEEIEFSTGFNDLHTEVYRQVLAGNGFGIEVARPSITLVHTIREADVVANPNHRHPLLG